MLESDNSDTLSEFQSSIDEPIVENIEVDGVLVLKLLSELNDESECWLGKYLKLFNDDELDDP